MRAATFLLSLVHLGVATLWLGSMAYSLFVVQPRVTRAVSDAARAEEIFLELGAGNRWRVIALIITLSLTGIGLVWIHDGRPLLWWVAVAAKVMLLAVASALLWWVSWRGWPRRIFALPAEIPAEQARFRRVAVAMAALIGAAFVLGVAMANLG